MNIFQRTFFLFLFFIPASILSSNNDTSKITEKINFTKWFTESQFENGDSLNDINTSLYGFHKYIPKTILGNTGLVEQNLIYSPMARAIGFKYSANNYPIYYNLPEKLKFYNTKVPYTDLFYVAGAQKEQLFKGTFSYNFRKNWNITADFCRIRSEGAYLRQGSNDNFISLSSNFKSKNNRYWLLSSIIYNSLKTAENGGISDDSLFENFDVNSKLLLVNLTNAKRTVENANIFLKQIINLGKKSTDTSNHNFIIPSSRLILTSSFDANSLRYQDSDPTSDFYRNIYYDSTETFDSTFYSKVENELCWRRLDNRKHRGIIDLVGFCFNLKHEQIKVHQRSLENTFNNFIIGGQVYNTYTSRDFWWNLSMNFVLSGHNQDDHLALLSLKKIFKDSISSLIFKIESRVQSPDFIYNKFLSNNFQWDNNFGKTIKEGGALSLILNKIRLETNFSFYNYRNVLYFDTTSLPRQFKGAIALFSSFIKKDFAVYNWHLDNKIIYQYLPDSSVIKVPELITENSLYYESDIFKNALHLQIGASLFYTTSYYSNAYMPATDQFYLQNNKKYGNYPFIDLFINAKIKTVRIFLKVDHLNSGFSGKKYILTPGYPYPERAFKFGISWRFSD